MKTRLLLAAFLCNALFGYAQTTFVPDDDFEQKLIDLGYDTGTLDDYVPTANIDTITFLNLFVSGISDLTGIEDFTALTQLVLNGNLLTTVNLSQNTNLTSLSCANNMLLSLDVSQNTNLTFLNCQTNQLEELDLTQNINLTQFNCEYNVLTLLNLKNGNNTSMNSSIDMRNNPNLICIEVDDAAWSTANWMNIDTTSSFSNDCHFDDTYVPDDIFEQRLIDLGHDSGILDDYVPTANINTLTSLNVASVNNSSPTKISDLTGIEDFVDLEQLFVGYNNLTTIDVSNNTALKVFHPFFNQLSSIDVSMLLLLENFHCAANNLMSINVSNNPNLTLFRCQANNISILDVSNNPNLYQLYANGNALTNLDVRNGNNAGIICGDFKAYSNPNLTCIYVDDSTYSGLSCWQKDAASTFVNDSSGCSTLSTDTFETSYVSVFPNPSKGHFTISLQKEAHFIVLNNNGRQQKSGLLNAGSNLLDITALPSGLYFLQLISSEGLSTIKIIKY